MKMARGPPPLPWAATPPAWTGAGTTSCTAPWPPIRPNASPRPTRWGKPCGVWPSSTAGNWNSPVVCPRSRPNPYPNHRPIASDAACPAKSGRGMRRRDSTSTPCGAPAATGRPRASGFRRIWCTIRGPTRLWQRAGSPYPLTWSEAPRLCRPAQSARVRRPPQMAPAHGRRTGLTAQTAFEGPGFLSRSGFRSDPAPPLERRPQIPS